MAGYSIESLERGIVKCEENIKIFENAIAKERKTIKEYRYMIDTALRKQKEREGNTVKVEG